MGGNGTATFTITEDSGVITGIQDGVAFALPVNEGCTPITYNFSAMAACDDDGSMVSGNLTASVTVYPTLQVITGGDNTCGPVATLEATDGSVCASAGDAAGNCINDLAYDFTSAANFTPPTGCPLPTNLTGTIACDCPCDGFITGTITVDNECDEVAGEVPAATLTIELLDGTCTQGVDCPTTTTDAAGNYSFGPLECGAYDVLVDETTLPCQQFAINNPQEGVLIDIFNETEVADFDFSTCAVPDTVGCLSVARVCDGNALYVVEPGTEGDTYPTPLNAGADWIFEWYLEGILVETILGLPYYSPNVAGSYTVYVSDFGSCQTWSAPCNPEGFGVDEIIDCQDCGK